MNMLYGFLIAFLIAFVIGISVAMVVVIALREVTNHIYEGGGYSPPMRGFKSHLRSFGDEDESGGKKASRHTHYHE